MVDCVHTLPRELRIAGAFVFEPGRYRGIEVPTALLRGTESPPDMHVGVELVHGAVAGSRVVTMAGVDHEAVTTGPDVLVGAIVEVLGAVRHSADTGNLHGLMRVHTRVQVASGPSGRGCGPAPRGRGPAA
jgi:hypothetical protein